MNRREIADHLCAKGFVAELTEEGNQLEVAISLAGEEIELLHVFPAQLVGMPRFLLRNAARFGHLAHVELSRDHPHGSVCVNDPDSLSINYDVPRLVYEESLKRHLALLGRGLNDPEWNRSELLREFRSHWDVLARHAKTDTTKLYIAYDPSSGDECQVKGPEPKFKFGINAHSVALGSTQYRDDELGSFRRELRWDKRAADGKTIVLQFDSIAPAPVVAADLAHWFYDSIGGLAPKSQDTWTRAKRVSSRVFWVICTAIIREDRVWFALRFSASTKAKCPRSSDECADWKIDPIPVRGLDRDSIVPRGGGQTALSGKSVLLVGCGSVGSELAHRLASLGIGHLTLSDPDVFSQDNLYRHTLSIDSLEFPKTFSLAIDLRRKYPWIRVNDQFLRLNDWKDSGVLSTFDLVVVAIGAPTIERQFAQFVAEHDIEVPTLYTWLEAFGVGGHAIVSLPRQRGCLFCAYVDPADFSRGLASNLNFLQPNQDVTRSQGGCGNLFLPYSAIASGHTANIAGDLAIRCLSGQLAESAKVSWRGDCTEAVAQGLDVTFRYRRFEESLKILPLYHPECGDCGGS